MLNYFATWFYPTVIIKILQVVLMTIKFQQTSEDQECMGIDLMCTTDIVLIKSQIMSTLFDGSISTLSFSFNKLNELRRMRSCTNRRLSEMMKPLCYSGDCLEHCLYEASQEVHTGIIIPLKCLEPVVALISGALTKVPAAFPSCSVYNAMNSAK